MRIARIYTSINFEPRAIVRFHLSSFLLYLSYIYTADAPLTISEIS